MDAPHTPPSPPHRFVALDGMRGFCALMVVGFHLNAGGHLRGLFANGYVGVDFFFVLSGFIIASAYGGRVKSGRTLAAACLKRVGRLYPLHLFVLGIWLAFVIVTSLASGHSGFKDKFSLPSLWENLLLIQAFTLNQESWNYTAWSISLELWLNVLYFLMALLTRRWLILAEGVACAASVAIGAAALLADADPSPLITAWVTDAHYALGFFLGALLFRLYRRIAIGDWRPPAWLTAAALAAGAAPFVAGDRIADLALPFLFAATVLVFAFDAGRLARLLAGRAGRHAGRVSFSIYLIHPFFTILTAMAILRLGAALRVPSARPDPTGDVLILGGPWIMDLALLACLAAVTVAAGITFRLIEDPGRRFVNALADRLMTGARIAPPGEATHEPKLRLRPGP